MFSRTRTFFIVTARGLALLICHTLGLSSGTLVPFNLSMWITAMFYVCSFFLLPFFFLIRKTKDSPSDSPPFFFSSLRQAIFVLPSYLAQWEWFKRSKNLGCVHHM